MRSGPPSVADAARPREGGPRSTGPSAEPPAPRPEETAEAPGRGAPPVFVPPALPPPVGAPSSPAPPRATAADFATNIGPRILVVAGGLAVVVFLALFVRYAWENDWVGPVGRVLIGVGGQPRPGGARSAPAGPEVPAPGSGAGRRRVRWTVRVGYAAHGVYDLVPRGLAGAVMIVVTVCAVAVADRLDTRLLAALAWVGGYLAPVLLSTGEDRAVSLFAYLLLLGAGAVWIDRRKPWPETLPLALVGTALLYVGWCAAHFRPERFAVAAAGLVLLSALFVLGTRWSRRTASGDPGGRPLRGRCGVALHGGRRRPADVAAAAPPRPAGPGRTSAAPLGLLRGHRAGPRGARRARVVRSLVPARPCARDPGPRPGSRRRRRRGPRGARPSPPTTRSASGRCDPGRGRGPGLAGSRPRARRHPARAARPERRGSGRAPLWPRSRRPAPGSPADSCGPA